mmetsp:Transcript_23936/g.66450  ORF Transcript_23936/g.66450 Transcript_23936/m.66450 type:complete len:214 (-) Transcript_23936:126-767(-)
MAVPWPSTSTPPPSMTTFETHIRISERSVTIPATLASFLCTCFLPHPLKLKFTAASFCVSVSFTNTGPESRIQRSSRRASISSTLSTPPRSCLALLLLPLSTRILTGSYVAMARAMLARSAHTPGTRFRPQMPPLATKDIQVHSWGSASSGIRQTPACTPLDTKTMTTESSIKFRADAETGTPLMVANVRGSSTLEGATFTSDLQCIGDGLCQ